MLSSAAATMIRIGLFSNVGCPTLLHCVAKAMVATQSTKMRLLPLYSNEEVFITKQMRIFIN